MWQKLIVGGCVALVVLCLPGFGNPTSAQEPVESAEAAKERIAAERFLQVLVRRPRPGTALDRVYGYHVQAGSLDQLEAKLKADAVSPTERGANLMLCGLLQLQRGNDAAAADSLALAETLRTEDAMTSFYLGKALLLIGKTDAAAEALQRSIDRKPEKSEALQVFTALGRLNSRSQQKDKALAVWKQLEATFPGDVRVGEQIARTLAEEGQNDAALERYQSLAKQASATDESRAVGYTIEAAEIKRRLGRHDESLKDFESLLNKLRPSSWLYADVRRRIENGFLGTGDYAALADYYAKQVELTPDNLELRLRLGHSLTKAGRLNDAETALEEATKRAPENVDARLALIEIYRTAGKSAKVAEQLETLIKQDSNNPDYYVRLGNSWLDDRALDKSARFKNAENAWQRLADLRKNDAVVLSQVADLMRRIDLVDKVIALYQRAIEIAPDQPQYREYLGEYLHRQDRKEEALKVWAGIAADSRANRDNFVRLGEVLLTFEYPDKSLDAFAEAAKLDLTFAQRLRYAELLSRAEKHDEALAQLDQAEQIAESLDEQEQLLAARIRAYGNSGTLEKRIDEAAKLCETSENAQDHRRLALMYDAAARTVEAMNAIQVATKREPNNVQALTLAADLYRKASRYSDAIEAYRALVKLDARFLSNYLKQIAALQMQLGQVDDAMATADELIAAQPGNPESYRVYAQQCFTLGRDDEGIEKLRRALQAAPRDIEAKRALAGALADHFRTDEAIELNWQLLNDSEGQTAKESIAGSLATLYERKGDFERLLERLELRGRESSNMREAILLTSAAYRATSDFGGARSVLEPLLIDNPRDAELLGQMVTLSEAAGEPEAALEYQRQVVTLADTPEQQNRLVNLQIASGQLDAVEAAVQRMQSTDDPLLILKLIDRAFNQNDMDLMVNLCQQAIKQRSNFWEARLRLVSALLSQGKYDEALVEADRFDALKLADDELSEAAKSRVKQSADRGKGGAKPNVRSLSASLTTFGYNQHTYELAMMFQLGPYADSRSSQRPDLFDLSDAGEAKSLMRSLRFVASIKQNKTEEFLKQFVALQDVEKIEDLDALRETLEISRLKEVFLDQRNSQGRQQQSDDTAEKVLWQIAKLDQEKRKQAFEQLLMMRMQKRFPEGLDGEEAKDLPPLSDQQFALLLDAYKDQSIDQSLNQSTSYLLISLQKELQAAGRMEDAESLAPKLAFEPKTLSQFSQALAREFAFKGPEGLAAQIEKVSGRWPELMAASTAMERGEAMQQLPSLITTTKMPIATKFKIIDLVLALNVDQRPNVGRPITRSRTGQINTYYRGGNSGSYTSKSVTVPFSPQLLSDSLVQQIHQVMPLTTKSDDQAGWLKHLEQDRTIHPAGTPQASAELKSRKVLLAFSKWWVEDLDGASTTLNELAKQWPVDNDLAIERARIAAEMDRPDEALAALDQINAVDQQTLQLRELAALNLSASLGKIDRGKVAAQRLFGMRLDTATEMTLADQMTRLGLNDLAKAVLQRSQRRGGQRVEDLLQIANRYLNTKENELAAEVAYKALRQLGTTPNGNESYYRQQIVQVLTQAKRLDALLKQAEQRVASAPKSLPLKMQLAELYTAAGRGADADKLFGEIAEQQPNDPKTMWQTATRLATSGKHDEAVDIYLSAIEKDPVVMQQDSYRLMNALQQSSSTDKAFERLAAMQLDRFDSYTLRNLAQYGRRTSNPSEAYLKFIDKVLEGASTEVLIQILGVIAQQPGIANRQSLQQTLVKIASTEEFYQPNNSMWVANSYSSDGVLVGALDPYFDVVKQNAELRKVVREEATKRVQAEKPSAVAKLLLLLIEVDDQLSAQEACKQFEQLLASKEDYETMHGQLWWQTAQRLEKIAGYEQMAVQILEKIQDREDLKTTVGSEYTVSAKLAGAYVTANQKEKARELLLKNFYSPSDRSRSINNPGYDEFRRINQSRELTAKLTKIGAQTDAIAVYCSLLNQPEMFAAARAWGSTDQLSIYEKWQADLIEKLTEQECLEFVTKRMNSVQIESTASKPDANAIPALALVPLQASAMTRFGAGSLAMLAINKLASSEDGKTALVELSTQLKERQSSSPDDWSIATMQVLLAISLKQDDLSSQLERYREQLTSLDLNAIKKDKREECLLNYVQPAMMLLSTDDKALKDAGTTLVKAVRQQAETAKLPSVIQAVAVATLKGVSSETDQAGAQAVLMAMLDSVAPSSDKASPAVASSAVANECLRVAEAAATAQQWTVMFEALRRGFGGGVPLLVAQPTTRTTRSVFIAPTVQSTRVMTTSRSEDVSQYTSRITDLFAKLEAALKEKANQEVSLAAYQTLQQMVLPEARPREVFAYLPDFNRNPSQSANVAELLVRVAVSTGQADTLKQLLGKRSEVCESPQYIEMLQGQLATANKDWPSVETSVKQLLARVDQPVNATAAQRGDMTSLRQVTPLWIVLKPLETINEVEPVYTSTMCKLLEFTSRDQMLFGVLPWDKVMTRLLSSKSINDDHVQQAIDHYLASIRLVYARSPDYLKTRLMSESQTLANLLIKQQRLSLVPKLLETFSQTAPAYNQAAGRFSQLALRLMQVDESSRYDLLWQMTFGSADSDACNLLGDVVMFAEPPAVLKSETVYEQALQVPLASPDFPLITNVMLLGDAAAKLNKSNELIKQLEKFSKASGDEYHAMIGTVLLAAGRYDEALPIMDAVSATLTATKSKGSGKMPMPIHSAIFAARAADAASKFPALTKPTQDAWSALLTHARERSIGLASSYVNRMVTRMGVDKAVGATNGSPLKHFVSYEIPYQTKPHVAHEATYLLKGKQIAYSSGNEQSLLMFRYPLAGDFTFQFMNERHGWGECFASYGGVTYKSNEYNKTAIVESPMGRGKVEWPNSTFENNENGNMYTLTLAGGEVIMLSNGKELLRDHRHNTMPFVGIHHQSHAIAVSKDYQLMGSPTIPREVSLLDPDLRGWGTPIFAEPMPKIDLPEPSGKATTSSSNSISAVWSFVDGALQSASIGNFSTRGDMYHVQYIRPLLEGESITYEFEFEPGKKEVHPTIGRVVILLREDGIKLRWLPLSQSLESLDMKPLHEIAVNESLGDGNPELKTGMNNVKLLAEGDRCIVTVNDKAIARVPMVLDRRFGLTVEKDRQAMVKNATLTGPWPTEVPKDIMEPAK